MDGLQPLQTRFRVKPLQNRSGRIATNYFPSATDRHQQRPILALLGVTRQFTGPCRAGCSQSPRIATGVRTEFSDFHQIALAPDAHARDT